MEESNGKIIVFRAFDTVVEANLAKTKLDAYGIPCFLSDENLTSLYPIRNGIFPGARLHIFEKDTEEVQNLLGHEPLESFVQCPHCGSANYKEENGAWNKIYNSALLLIGLIFPVTPKEYQCKNCGSAF